MLTSAYWDDYQQAYSDAFIKCNTEAAPWYAVPAGRRWYRNWAVTEILAEQLRRWRWLGRPPKAGTSRRNARGWQPTGDRSTAGARRSYVVLTSLLVTPFFTPSGPVLPNDPF